MVSHRLERKGQITLVLYIFKQKNDIRYFVGLAMFYKL